MVSTATLILFAYMVFMLFIGWYASRFTKPNPADYYVASGTLGTVVITFTLVATVLSSFQMFGVSAAASTTGFGIYAYLGLVAPIYALLFIVIGSRLHRIGREKDLLTAPEFLRERYESRRLGLVYVLVSAVFLVPFLSVQIIGGGVALESLVSLDYTVAIAMVVVFMAIYVHIAGMRGVVWSDLIQGLLMFTILVGMFLFVNIAVGGREVVTRILAEHPDMFSIPGPTGTWTPAYIFTFTAVLSTAVAVYPHTIQRYFAARSLDIVKKSAFYYAAVVLILDVVGVALGVWSLAFVDPSNPDYAIALMFKELANPVVFGFTMSAALALIMSTTDSITLTLSSMGSRDVYKQFVETDISDEKEVKITQTLLIVLLAVAFVIAWSRPAGIFDLAALTFSGLSTTFPVFVFAIFWDEASEEAAYLSMILGSLTVILFFFEIIPTNYRFGLHYGFIGLIVSVVVFFTVSKITAQPSQNAVRQYT